MTLKFNVFLQKTIAMRSIILLKIVMVAIISVVYIASSCTKNTSSNSRIDQVCDNFNSVSDTAHRDSSNFLTQLGISLLHLMTSRNLNIMEGFILIQM